MNIDKAEFKLLVAEDIGASIEDTLEAAKKEMQHWDGAAKAFAKAAQTCTDMATHVDTDLDAGEYGIETAKIIKRYIERCANANATLHRRAESSMIASSGKISALETTMTIITKYRDVEKLNIASAKVIETAPGVREVVENRPMGIKERRRLEEAELDAAAREAAARPEIKVNGVEAGAPVEVVAQEPKAPARRRGRPPKIKIPN